MDETVAKKLINDTDVFVFVVATGYPSRLQELLALPCGASRLLAGAQLPYSNEESQLFACVPEPLKVDEASAVNLAHAAYVRAVANLTQLDELHRDAVGLAVTAVVATSREHRGAHRAIVAATSRRGTTLAYVPLKKGVGDEDRALDALACDEAALCVLCQHVGINMYASPNGACTQRALEAWRPRTLPADEELAAVLLLPFFGAAGSRQLLSSVAGTRMCLVPATLNPLHVGHFDMLRESQSLHGLPATYVVSAAPPKGAKPRLAGHEALHRVGQVVGWNRRHGTRHSVLIAGGDSLYEAYCRMFPGSIVSVGADAALRMLEPRWYADGDVSSMIRRISSTGCIIRVHPRKCDSGVVKTAADVLDAAPADARSDMAGFVKAGLAQHDVSSSVLRSEMLLKSSRSIG